MVHRVRGATARELIRDALFEEIESRIALDAYDEVTAEEEAEVLGVVQELVTRPPGLAGLHVPSWPDTADLALGRQPGSDSADIQIRDAAAIQSDPDLASELERLSRLHEDRRRIAKRLERQLWEASPREVVPATAEAVRHAIEACTNTHYSVEALAIPADGLGDVGNPLVEAFRDPGMASSLVDIHKQRQAVMDAIARNADDLGDRQHWKHQWAWYARFACQPTPIVKAASTRVVPRRRKRIPSGLAAMHRELARMVDHFDDSFGAELARRALADGDQPGSKSSKVDEEDLCAAISRRLKRVRTCTPALSDQLGEPARKSLVLARLLTATRRLLGRHDEITSWDDLGRSRRGRRIRRDLAKLSLFPVRCDLAVHRFERNLNVKLKAVHDDDDEAIVRRGCNQWTIRAVRTAAHGGPNIAQLAFFGGGLGADLIQEPAMRARLTDAITRTYVLVEAPAPEDASVAVGEEPKYASELARNSPLPSTMAEPVAPYSAASTRVISSEEPMQTPRWSDDPFDPAPRLARRLLQRIPLRSRQKIILPARNAAQSGTYHLTLEVPPGAFVTDARVETTLPDGTRHTFLAESEPAGSRAHVHLSSSVVAANKSAPVDLLGEDSVFIAELWPAVVGLPVWTFLLTVLSLASTLLVSFILPSDLSDAGGSLPGLGAFAEVAAAGLLLLPAFAAGLLIVPSEHTLVERLHRVHKMVLALVALYGLAASSLLASWSVYGQTQQIELATMALIALEVALVALSGWQLSTIWLAASRDRRRFQAFRNERPSRRRRMKAKFSRPSDCGELGG